MSMSAATFRHMDRAADEYDVASRSFGREFGSKPFDAALFHVNADAVCDAILYDKSCRLSNAYRIGFYLWELDKLPRTHRLGCMVVDEIWTPSEFLRELYSQCTDKKVTNVKKYVMLSNVAALTRATDKSRFKFLTSFDFHSGVERKNPIALVRAFQRAFPRHRTDVQLTIKTTEFVPDHWGDANGQWLLVKQASAADPRISVIETALSEQEYFCLISNHDCVVSAHRAEGFGYLPAYAMSLGVPVIVTDYSGTRDFCSTETSFPVSFKLIEVRPGEFIADVPGARWADIDIDDLAATLRIVREGGSDVEDRAKRGQQLMRAEYSLDAHARRYKQLLTDRGLLAAL
jgi:glycosyltransferase involved in cell wall biosynthesis